MSRPSPWTIADVLDFEHLLSSDADAGTEAARQRDLKLYREQIAPQFPKGILSDRGTVFHRWLELRRASLGAESPGAYFNTGWQTILTLAVIGGFALGVAVAGGVLYYHENEPVNAIEVLKWTLLPQWLFLIGALVVLTLRRTLGLGDRFEPLRAFVRGLMDGFAALLRRLPGEKRAAVSRTFARVREHRDRYGALATWPVVIATQLFAVCFNLGIIGTLLTEVTVRELRFGWQTTLEVSPKRVGELVSAFALPWSWAPDAHPNLEQIAATRYAPGQRHETLPAAAMRSWWPFLVYAIAFYGLAVRGALFLVAVVKLRAALKSLQFHYPEANALWHRMLGPVFAAEETQASPSSVHSADKPGQEVHRPGAVCWVLMAQEAELNEAELGIHVEKSFGWRPAQFLRVKIDNRRANAEQLEQLRAAAPRLGAVVIVAPARRDPIVAIALFIRDVVGAVGNGAEVMLLLTGSSSDAQRLQFWRDFQAEHQLGISIEPWLRA